MLLKKKSKKMNSPTKWVGWMIASHGKLEIWGLYRKYKNSFPKVQ